MDFKFKDEKSQFKNDYEFIFSSKVYVEDYLTFIVMNISYKEPQKQMVYVGHDFPSIHFKEIKTFHVSGSDASGSFTREIIRYIDKEIEKYLSVWE